MIPVEHNPFLSLFADRGEQPLSENMLNIRLLKQGPHFPRMLEKQLGSWNVLASLKKKWSINAMALGDYSAMSDIYLSPSFMEVRNQKILERVS